MLRILSIPAVPEGSEYGLFEDIHEFNNSAKFANHLQRAAQKYHGIAFRAFILRAFIQAAANNYDDLVALYDNTMNQAIEEYSIFAFHKLAKGLKSLEHWTKKNIECFSKRMGYIAQRRLRTRHASIPKFYNMRCRRNFCLSDGRDGGGLNEKNTTGHYKVLLRAARRERWRWQPRRYGAFLFQKQIKAKSVLNAFQKKNAVEPSIKYACFSKNTDPLASNLSMVAAYQTICGNPTNALRRVDRYSGETTYLVYPRYFDEVIARGIDAKHVKKLLKDKGILETDGDHARYQKNVRIREQTYRMIVLNDKILNEDEKNYDEFKV